MNIEIHYGGQSYEVLGGKEGAAELLHEAMGTIRSGGGTIAITTKSGTVTCVIGANIPFAIVETAAPRSAYEERGVRSVG